MVKKYKKGNSKSIATIEIQVEFGAGNNYYADYNEAKERKEMMNEDAEMFATHAIHDDIIDVMSECNGELLKFKVTKLKTTLIKK